jgi:hypothetical protein
MLTLRLTQQVENPPDSYRVDVVLDDKVTSQSTTVYFKFNINEQDQEKIRWYLEDFLEYPQVPAPTIAATIEQQMVAIGVELFEKLFQANNDTRQIWSQLRHRLNHTRVEIVTGVTDAAAIPWELIRNPDHNLPLVLQTGAFVRTHPNPQPPPQLPETDSSKMRILLVICRPKGGDDVPFRSVATQLIRGLTDSAREIFQLDVLRPPTFQRLEEVLRQAKAERKPYHKPWLHPHIFGYSVPELNNAELSIQSASDINADHTLQNTSIQIILKQMYVEAYPGGGTHQIFFNFEATHQLNDHVESLNFPTTQRVREKSVANINQPIFKALNVGVQGAAFRCAAVNVKNEEDERILKRLESPLFQPGLTLFTMIANPAIGLFSELGIALISLLANRYKNYIAQKFDLGLDFSNDSTRARLAEGYYLAIQIPESLQTSWDWEDWVYNPTNGQIVSQFDPTEVIPYNYLVFSVSRHQEN